MCSEFYRNSSSRDPSAIVTLAGFEWKQKIETYPLFESLNRSRLTGHNRRAMSAIFDLGRDPEVLPPLS
jgi:hypothetical protein